MTLFLLVAADSFDMFCAQIVLPNGFGEEPSFLGMRSELAKFEGRRAKGSERLGFRVFRAYGLAGVVGLGFRDWQIFQ